MTKLRIGIDLGGTKIEGLALAAGGDERARLRIATPREDYDATLAAIAGLVADLEREAGAETTAGATVGATVGIGIPGMVSPATGLVKNANSTWLIGQPFDRDLAARLKRPVRVANDANCFALSEAVDGAAAGADPVFGVILGTGVGGGLVVGGRPVVGANAIGGEWGHNPLPWPRDDERPGPRCYCGQHGCIETFLSGPGLQRDHERAGGAAGDAAQIARRAAAGEAAAGATLARYAERLARALAHVVNIVDPEVIVLGGGLSNIDGLTEDVPRAWGRHVFSDSVATRLVRAAHGDASGVRGAAWLWEEDEAP